MPWSGPSFQKHNHGLSPAQAAHAALIANHVLRSTGNEGEAIATANKLIHRDAGGAMPQQGGIGGVTPATAGSNPMIAGIIQRYAALPTEKLTELAQQMGNSPQGTIIQKLLAQRRVQPEAAQQQPMPPPTTASQGAAPGYSGAAPAIARGGVIPKRAGGGDMGVSPSQASPWWTRSDARQDTSQPALGYLEGSTPGRADAIDTTAPAGSHVIPADVVAGLGEGNSLAGAKRMEEVIRTGPHGVSLPGSHGERGPPRPPAPYRDSKGGNVHDDNEHDDTPVLLSHGEYVVHPRDVLRWGRGNRKAGHEAWDRWIVDERKRQIKQLQKLKGPVKT